MLAPAAEVTQVLEASDDSEDESQEETMSLGEPWTE